MSEHKHQPLFIRHRLPDESVQAMISYDFGSLDSATDKLARRGFKVMELRPATDEDILAVAGNDKNILRRLIESVPDEEWPRPGRSSGPRAAQIIETARQGQALMLLPQAVRWELGSAIILDPTPLPFGAQQLGFIAVDCVFGGHLIKDMLTDLRDVFGGRAATLEKLLDDARENALADLRLKAVVLGATRIAAFTLRQHIVTPGNGGVMAHSEASGIACK